MSLLCHSRVKTRVGYGLYGRGPLLQCAVLQCAVMAGDRVISVAEKGAQNILSNPMSPALVGKRVAEAVQTETRLLHVDALQIPLPELRGHITHVTPLAGLNLREQL